MALPASPKYDSGMTSSESPPLEGYVFPGNLVFALTPEAADDLSESGSLDRNDDRVAARLEDDSEDPLPTGFGLAIPDSFLKASNGVPRLADVQLVLATARLVRVERDRITLTDRTPLLALIKPLIAKRGNERLWTRGEFVDLCAFGCTGGEVLRAAEAQLQRIGRYEGIISVARGHDLLDFSDFAWIDGHVMIGRIRMSGAEIGAVEILPPRLSEEAAWKRRAEDVEAERKYREKFEPAKRPVTLLLRGALAQKIESRGEVSRRVEHIVDRYESLMRNARYYLLQKFTAAELDRVGNSLATLGGPIHDVSIVTAMAMGGFQTRAGGPELEDAPELRDKLRALDTIEGEAILDAQELALSRQISLADAVRALASDSSI